MEVRVKQESQDEALVPLCGKSSNINNNSHSANGSGINPPGPMQKVPSLSDLSDPESSLGKSTCLVFSLKILFFSTIPTLFFIHRMIIFNVRRVHLQRCRRHWHDRISQSLTSCFFFRIFLFRRDARTCLFERKKSSGIKGTEKKKNSQQLCQRFISGWLELIQLQ